jgi:L-fucose mutarotase/ribose pyranase (RbsD/FucU family)
MPHTPRLTKSDWQRQLKALLPLYGHRNWIVVADSAYPAQSKPGIETIASGAGQLEVVRKVLDAVAVSRHVRANVYLDQELEFVPESDAPGVTKYRKQLAKLLSTASPIRLPHEQIIAKLDQVSQVFQVLIIKTELTIPYTSVFFELDCAYWSADAETKLRKAMHHDLLDA